MVDERQRAECDVFGEDHFATDRLNRIGLTLDGHDLPALMRLMENVPDGTGKPIVVIAHTVKGKGISFMEDDNNWHYRIPKAEEVAAAKPHWLAVRSPRELVR